MSELPAPYDDGRPVHFTVAPIDELSGKSRALSEAYQQLERLREQLEAQRLTWGASFSELDNELEGCREVSFKAQRERNALRKAIEALGEEWTPSDTKQYVSCLECRNAFFRGRWHSLPAQELLLAW